MPVNEENFRKWLDALRSGNYRQGRHVLEKPAHGDEPTQYCCLGVACRVAMENGVELEVKETTTSVEFDSHSGQLPGKVLRWLGVSNYSLLVQTSQDGVHVPVSIINDDGECFANIADLLEQTYLTNI